MPKLAPGGCILLFQAGGKPDRPAVLAEAEQQGWTCLYAISWHKGASRAPVDTAEPYWASSERILVFARGGEHLESAEVSLNRSDIMSIPSITQNAAIKMSHGKSGLTFYDLHQFQKPAELMQNLIRKHTFSGDLVVDAFSCSGVTCIEAARLGRRWVYIESNKNNFEWGSQRVMKNLNELQVKAG